MKEPMPCPEWADYLAARTSEDLSLSQQEALAAHLAACPTCAQVSKDYDELTARVRAIAASDHSLNLTHQVLKLRATITTWRKQQAQVHTLHPYTHGKQRTSARGILPQRSQERREGVLRVADDARLYYQIIGNRPDTLLIPAAQWSMTDCTSLIQYYTLIFYDRYPRRPSELLLRPVMNDQQEQAALHELELLCQYLALRAISLVGWSFFGRIIIRYALKHPEHISRLLLVRPIALPRLENDALRSHVFPAHSQDILPWYQEENEAPKAASIRLPNVASCHIPTLVIHGMDDPLPLKSSYAWAAALPNARLLTMAGAGPSPWQDAPDTFFTAATQFLAGAWPQAAVPIHA